ncbi:MAG: ATP-binding protein [Desulfobacteraceae bacterium]|nr:ATP-binding protein [Desulfobacteraceae bacterium]
MEKQSFKANLESIQKIQDFVGEILKGKKSDKAKLFKINILIEEIVVNIVNYAFNNSTEGVIDIEIDTPGDKMFFKISDNGIPFDPLKAKEPDIGASLENRNVGGLGIFFVKQIAKDISYSYKNNKNCISLVIEP